MKKLAVMAVIAVVLALAASAPGQDVVKQRLEKSPRHHEWVEVKNGNRIVHCFVVYPQVKTKATAMIVLHENKGLTDWVRSVADRVAEEGYIAIAPDMLSGFGPGGGNTKEFKSTGDATKAIGALKADGVTADLNAVADYAISIPACNGKLAIGGFCWGGGQTFRFATNRKDLKAAFVFYGSFQETKEALGKIPCPVYGFYGEDDMRINASIPKTTATMKELGKPYEPVIYDGAGHGFMRAGDEANTPNANSAAKDKAWKRMLELLKKV
jgi:carboxymethylenebutenolidase